MALRKVVGEPAEHAEPVAIRSDKLKRSRGFQSPRPPQPVPPSATVSTPPPEQELSTHKELRKLLSQRYRLLGTLSKGGMGTVYKAKDVLLQMAVAVKVLNPKLSHDPVAIAAMKKEARVAMQLSHQHIVRLYGIERSGLSYFLVMELVEGRTLRNILNSCGRLAPDTVRDIIAVCAEAVSYAHRHGVLHNDLKPGNLMLGKNGILKIIDFGIASAVNKSAAVDYIEGTPAYMSPEHLRGEVLDCRADVYSLGVIAWELLCGKAPFPDDVSSAAKRKATAPDLSELAEETASVLAKALAPDREERWNSVESFAQAFEAAVRKEGAAGGA